MSGEDGGRGQREEGGRAREGGERPSSLNKWAHFEWADNALETPVESRFEVCTGGTGTGGKTNEELSSLSASDGSTSVRQTQNGSGIAVASNCIMEPGIHYAEFHQITAGEPFEPFEPYLSNLTQSLFGLCQIWIQIDLPAKTVISLNTIIGDRTVHAWRNEVDKLGPEECEEWDGMEGCERVGILLGCC